MSYTLKQVYFKDGVKMIRPIPVKDGEWVVPHVGTGHEFEAAFDEEGELLDENTTDYDYAFVGPEPVGHVLDRGAERRSGPGEKHSSNWASLAFVGERPFGVILTKKENDYEESGLHFFCARQVYKGELGHRPEIARPRFAREAPESDAVVSTLTGRPIRQRDRRRGKIAWARLADVAALLGMDTKEFVLRYARFAHAEHAILDVRFAAGFEEIHGKPARTPERFSAYGLEKLFVRDLSTAWIRKGFACAALYLHHLGHVPEPYAVAPPRVKLAPDVFVISR